METKEIVNNIQSRIDLKVVADKCKRQKYNFHKVQIIKEYINSLFTLEELMSEANTMYYLTKMYKWAMSQLDKELVK